MLYDKVLILPWASAIRHSDCNPVLRVGLVLVMRQCGWLVAILLLSPLEAWAEDVYWTLPANQSGDWSESSNWGGTLPTSSDNAYIANGGTATISSTGPTCDTFYIGTATGSGAVQMLSGNLSTDTIYQYIGYGGTGTFTQSGGTNDLHYGGCVLGFGTNGSGTYNLSGSGQMSAYELVVGWAGTGTFEQTGGTNTLILQLELENGMYNLSGTGQLSAPREDINNSDTGFTQSGGTNTISGDFRVRHEGTYNLGGTGQLSAPFEYIGDSGQFEEGLFRQTGGTNKTSYLYIDNLGRYELGGGTLEITSGFSNQGVFDGSGGGSLLLNSTNCLVDFTQGTFQNAKSISLNIGANSLIIVPAGFDTTVFGSYTCTGLTHIAGTTLNLAEGQGFGGSGSINDPVNCQGTITAVPNGYIDLNNGLILSGNGNVSLNQGNLTVNDSISEIKSGALSGNGLGIGNTGTGLFTQSGGAITIGSLSIGASPTGNGTYILKAGTLSCNASEIIGEFSGTGNFTQSGGTNTAGTMIIGYNPGGSGAYDLSTGQLTAYTVIVGCSGTGTFNQFGGTNTIGGLSLGSATGGMGTYNLNGGTLIISSIGNGSGVAAFNFGGGTLKASSGLWTTMPMTLTGIGGNANVDTASGDITLSGILSGPGGLNKLGTNTLTLSGTNTYAGNTTVNAGKLTLTRRLAGGGR